MGMYISVYSQTVNGWPGDKSRPPSQLSTIDYGPKPRRNTIPSDPGANGKRGILDYWLKKIGVR
jgi:hypothetical protein